MKLKVVVTGLMAALIASASFAQNIENDDMYFTSKDREKLKTKQAEDELAYQAKVRKSSRKNDPIEEDVYASSDSYSARNVNPEFAARSNSQSASSDNEDYFVSDYRYNNASNLNNWNNNFNSWYSNPWYNSAYFSPSIYGWNSPYYGSYYDSWGNPWANPYYRSGWSSSFSYYGSPWNYGWGSGMGLSFAFGNSYNSWYGWNSPYSYGGFGYSNWYYPRSVIIVNNGEAGRNVVYGKRGSRSGAVTTRQEALNSGRTRGTYNPSNGSNSGRLPSRGTSDNGGRIATSSTMPTRTAPSRTSQRQDDYYDRSWRNSGSTGSTSGNSRSSGMWSTPSRSSNNDNSGFNNNSNNSSFNAGSRSSSFGNGGGATRSSGGSFNSSGSGGRTRGRD